MNDLENAPKVAPPSTDALRPTEVAHHIEAANVQRASMPTRALLVLGLLGGLYIGFGGALATLALTDNSLGYGGAPRMPVVRLLASRSRWPSEGRQGLTWVDSRHVAPESRELETVVRLVAVIGGGG